MAALLAGPPPSSAARAAVCAFGTVTLGLCALGWLDSEKSGRRHEERLRERWRWIALAGGAWLCGELVYVALVSAETASTPLAHLRLQEVVTYLSQVQGGRVSLVVLAATTLLTAGAIVTHRGKPGSTSSAFAVACLALIAPPLTGHMSQQPVTALLIVAHALAAALWCGLLGAIAVTARSRGDWARLLPRFSTLAPWCVAVVLVSGSLSAAMTLANPAALVTTGYGRLVCAKATILLGLIAMAWWWRRTWVPLAQTHRAAAESSLRRAAIETALMASALAVAGSLATSP